jgi:hypothetical protein
MDHWSTTQPQGQSTSLHDAAQLPYTNPVTMSIGAVCWVNMEQKHYNTCHIIFFTQI